MSLNIELYKGIHPGRIIDRELKKRGISQRAFAAIIGEHSQTLNAIVKGRRSMTIEQSYKLEKELGYDEGTLALLQTQYDYSQYKRHIENERYTGQPNIRKIVFWDTNFENIEWGYSKRAVITRVLECGNEAEKAEIARFYELELSELDRYKSPNPYKIQLTSEEK